MYFALLLGIFFSHAPAAEPDLGLHRSRRTPRMDEKESRPLADQARAAQPVPEQIKNPFLDD